MKSILKKLTSAVIASSLALGCASTSFAYSDVNNTIPGGVNPTFDYPFMRTQVHLHNDSERTDFCTWHDLEKFSNKIYYSFYCDEGYYMTGYYLPFDLEYVNTDEQYFILSDSEENKRVFSSNYKEDVFDTTFQVLAGDFDNNMKVNLVDIVLMIRHLAGLEFVSENEISKKRILLWGDYNRDGSFDLTDVVMVIRVLAGLDPCPHGGLQTGDITIMGKSTEGRLTSVSLEVTGYYGYEWFRTRPCGEYSNSITILSSYEDYTDFIGNLDMSFPIPQISGNNEEQQLSIENEIEKIMNRTQDVLMNKQPNVYTEEFFETYEILVSTITGEGLGVFSRGPYIDIIDGVYTHTYYTHGPNHIGTNGMIEVDTHLFHAFKKGTFPEDAQFAIRVLYGES